MSDPAYPDALPARSRLHWYVLERVLGQGGFGITYLARDTNLDQPVAVKEYLPADVATRTADATVRSRTDGQNERYRWGLDRFIREARTLARFDHPNIVRVHSVFEQNNTAYMVMRFEEGENFGALLERRRTLPESELLRVLLPVLDGLELVHGAGFIHRDIKPENIHLRADGSPVLLDFGSARSALENSRSVTILVAPGYAPFEQYYSSGESQGPWTDLYGLGATCYRAITGVPPMDAIARSKGVLGSTRELLVPAITIGAGRYSPRLLKAVDHALEFAEKDRPQSIAAWRRELLEGRSGARPGAAAASQERRPLARNLVVGAAVATVAAVSGGISAYFAIQGSKPEVPSAAPLALPVALTVPEPVPSPAAAPVPVVAPAPAAASAPVAPAPVAAPRKVAQPVKVKVPEGKAPREAAQTASTQESGSKIEMARTNEQPQLDPPSGEVPAFNYYLGHAHRGNGEAALKIGESYESGRGTAQNNLWACGWYEVAARRGIAGAKARKDAVTLKLQPRELAQCQDWADGQVRRSG